MHLIITSLKEISCKGIPIKMQGDFSRRIPLKGMNVKGISLKYQIICLKWLSLIYCSKGCHSKMSLEKCLEEMSLKNVSLRHFSQLNVYHIKGFYEKNKSQNKMVSVLSAFQFKISQLSIAFLYLQSV